MRRRDDYDGWYVEIKTGERLVALLPFNKSH